MDAPTNIISQTPFASSLLIINIDDYGWTSSRDQAVANLYKKHCISSTSVLINGYNASKAIEDALALDLPMGLHINLTEGLPIRQDIANNTLLKQALWQRSPSEKETICEVFHGKWEFYEMIAEKRIKKEHIFKEIQAQIELFVKIAKKLPTHIDGHNHIHMIPEVAEIIAEIMTCNWGIYKIRIPDELFEVSKAEFEGKQKLFIENMASMIPHARNIYFSKNIFSTDYFVGNGMMGRFFSLEKLQEYLTFCNEKKNEKRFFSLELMSHAGFPSKDFGDDFNRSEERLHEYNVLYSNDIQDFCFKNHVKLASFKELRPKFGDVQYNILICSDFSPASGNLIHCLRIKNALNAFGRVYMRNIHLIDKEDPINLKNEALDIENLIKELKINLILCLNVWKSARFFQFICNNHHISLKIPLILVIAGTDANVSINDPIKREILSDFCKEASAMVSLTHSMKEIFLNHIPNIPQIHIIENSACIETNSQFSFKKFLNLPVDSKIILLPASIRKIKDIRLAVDAMSSVLLDFPSHYFIICGSIREQSYYHEIQTFLSSKTQAFPSLASRIQILDYILYEDLLSVLKETSLLLNTSLAEGMPCSIIEAIGVGVPVLVRNNEGNLSIIQDNVDGLVFKDIQEFSSQYHRVFNEPGLSQRLILKGKEKFQRYSSEREREKYQEIAEKVLKNSFTDVFIKKNRYRFAVSQEVHQLMQENNELFDNIQLWNKENVGKKNLKILDMGCGNGVFGFFAYEKCKESGFPVENLVFSDISMEALRVCYTNCSINEENLDEIKTINFTQSDLFTNIKGKFDIITCNFPQTPSDTPFRLDRWGKEDGAYYKVNFLREVSQFIHENSLIFMIHISLSNPQRVYQEIKEKGLVFKKIFVQKRKVLSSEFNQLQSGLFEYLLKNREKGLSEFEIEVIDGKEGEYIIHYAVEILSIEQEKK